MQTLSIQGEPNQSITTAFALFEEIGFELSSAPPPQFSVETLKALPEIADPWKLSFLAILKLLGEAVDVARPELCQSLLNSEIRFCLEHGRSPYLLQCVSGYAISLYAYQGHIKEGYELGEFTIESLPHTNNLVRASILEVFYALLYPWKGKLTDTLVPLEQAYRIGIETGDEMIGGASALAYLDHLRAIGMPLPRLQQKYTQYRQDLEKLGWLYHQPYAEFGQMLVEQLQGIAVQGDSRRTETLNNQQNFTALFCYYFCCCMSSYLLSNNRTAIAAASKARMYQGAVTGLHINAELLFYESLALLTGGQDHPRVTENYRQMEFWAAHAPENFQQKLEILALERARVRKEMDRVPQFCDRAIAAARQNSFVQDEALANELAGRFYWQLGNLERAKSYLQEAYHCYGLWGATAKLGDLEARYAPLVKLDRPQEDSSLDRFYAAIEQRFLDALGDDLKQVLATGIRYRYEPATQTLVLIPTSPHVESLVRTVLPNLQVASPAGIRLRIQSGY